MKRALLILHCRAALWFAFTWARLHGQRFPDPNSRVGLAAGRAADRLAIYTGRALP
jgi:hypothetical protein